MLRFLTGHRLINAVVGPILKPVGAASTRSASNGQPTAVKTLGLFLQEQAGFNDRLFVTAAVRTDQNSAFGTNFQHVVYPKASVSWVVSDEGFFPRFSWLDQLRLRTAYGASGVQPLATAGLTGPPAPFLARASLRSALARARSARATAQAGGGWRKSQIFRNLEIKPRR